jgi:hypothetical protein
LALFFATTNKHNKYACSLSLPISLPLLLSYFGLPCLFPPNSKNPSASSPLFLHSPAHHSPTTPPTTIQLLKGKEGEFLRKKFNPKKRERERERHTHTHTHSNTQRSFTREICWCFVCIFFISFWIVGWIFRVNFFVLFVWVLRPGGEGGRGSGIHLK